MRSPLPELLILEDEALRVARPLAIGLFSIKTGEKGCVFSTSPLWPILHLDYLADYMGNHQ
jgi:hypothetical protein